MVIPAGSKLVMIGDSITDCGRVRPIGRGSDEALGHGYVSLVNGLIRSTYPAMGLRISNMGIGGNTVRDLAARWQSDVLNLTPDWLSIKIGINDVWRHFGGLPHEHVPLEEYSQTLEELVSRTLPTLKGLVLMTPYYIEPNRNEPMRAMMDKYGDVVRGLADQYGAILVDTQAAFDEVLKSFRPADLADDQVHPNLTGHLVLARAFLQAVGYVW